MPKLKEPIKARRSASGRLAPCKIVRSQSKMRSILTSKETKTKRKLAHSALVSDADYAKVARMIQYA